MAQIIRITSEALQATIRRLLPSQQGFGEDLQASNIIQPIIDLTPTAEGSSVPSYLQQAAAHGSNTFFNVSNSTSSLVTGGGFYRIFGTATVTTDAGCFARIKINDGLGDKVLWNIELNANGGNNGVFCQDFDLVAFLRPTDSLQVQTNNAAFFISGSYRQIADGNGVLVNPSGFTPQ